MSQNHQEASAVILWGVGAVRGKVSNITPKKGHEIYFIQAHF